MQPSRRELLAALLATPSIAAKSARLRVGAMDGLVKMAGRPEALAEASRLGCEGLQVTIGSKPMDGRLPLLESALQERYLAESHRNEIPIASTYLDILHTNCLKNDALAPKWVAQGIELTRKLNARILMLVFFGKCSLQSASEMDAVASPLKELAPEAAKAGVVLGFENTISADDDLRVLEKVNSPALKVYYDIGNATNLSGFDPANEIRRLGKANVCQFHFKDKGYLGEGKVDVRAALKAIVEIGWEGYIILETGAPSGDAAADLRRNLEYTRRLIREV